MSIRIPDFRFLIVVFLSLQAFSALAQIQVVSPYSRYGLGNIAGNNNAWGASLGQLGIGVQSPYHVNYINPASYSAFDSLSFLFEGGFNGEVVTLNSEYQKTTRSHGSLGYLLFGMPVNRWWKTSLGLVPYSEVGYNVANFQKYPASGTVARVYSGSGGISRIYWGNAFRVVKGLSIGINASYLFGSMVREASVLFPDSINAMNFSVLNYVTMSDLNFSFGAQYRTKIDEKTFMTLGAVFTPTLDMAARADVLATTFLRSATGVMLPRDTLALEAGYKGKIILPYQIGAGLSFEQDDRWMIGADFKWQNWESFRAFEINDSLKNSWMISAGGQIIPNIDNFSNYLARVHYRLGFLYGKTYLDIRNEHLSEWALSVGLGFPLRGMKTMVNLSMQYGGRGTVANELIRENYFRLVVGFSIYERWFVKRRYF